MASVCAHPRMLELSQSLECQQEVLRSAQPPPAVSYPVGLVLFVSSVPSVPPCLLASKLLPWLMHHEYCIVVGS